MDLFGRTIIYCDEDEINSSNIKDVIEDAMETHETNRTQIEYLYNYYRGNQDILDRVKSYNSDINNKIVENRAYQITNFKTGYLLSAPIQYIDMSGIDGSINDELARLVSWMDMQNKAAIDLNVATWQSICGTAYKMIMPNSEATDYEIESPFEIYVLDPRDTFIVYSSKLGHKPLMGVTYVTLEDDTNLYYCYTKSEYFVLDNDYKVVESQTHFLNKLPMTEYPLNFTRIGDFECVISLLDAINTAASNRLDGVEQFVQAILCLQNMDTDDPLEFMTQLRELGAMFLPKESGAFYLTQELNQEQTQTLVDDLYDAVLDICGIPSRNGASGSTSDTGSAVILRNGWSDTESRAKRTEMIFKKSEREFLNLAILICNTVAGTNIVASNVGINFPRRNYTNDSSNVTNLVQMLSSDWIRPEFAYEHCNMTPDPHKEYLLAKEWHDRAENDDVEKLASEDLGDVANEGTETDNGSI